MILLREPSTSRKIHWGLLAAFLSLGCAVETQAETAQRQHFLSHGPGAEARGLGEAFTAIADDVTAMYYNPAGLVFQSGAVHAEHTPVFEGGRYNFLAAHYPSSFGSFGFGVIQYADSDIEGRQTLSDAPQSLDASQTAFYLPYGFGSRNWSVGSSIKILRYNLAGYADTGWGLDLGGLYAQDFNDFLGIREPTVNFGLSIKNLIQPAIKLVAEEERLPTDYKAGIALLGNVFSRYNRDRNVTVSDQVKLSVDLAKFKDQSLHPSMGGEFSFRDMFPLRLGYDDGITGGIGYGGSKLAFKIDYSFALTGLGPQHRFSLEYKFTEPKVKRTKAPQAQAPLGILREVKRYRDRHMQRGKTYLGNREYEKAGIEFEYARLLDPDNSEVQRYSSRAWEADQLARVKGHLDAANAATEAHQYDSATNNLLAAASILPNNDEVRASFPALRNQIIKFEQNSEFPEVVEEMVKAFDDRRQNEVEHLRTEHGLAVQANDLAKSRHLVAQANTIYPDNAQTQALSEDQRVGEEGLYNRCIELSKKNRASGDYSEAYAYLNTAKLVHKDSDAIREEDRIIKEVYAKRRRDRRASKLFEEQLYDAAALSYVKGNTDDSVKQLNELLTLNPTSRSGAELRKELLAKGFVRED